MEGVTMERALKPHMPVEMTELNNITTFNIYSAVCTKYVSNNCVEGNVFVAAAVYGGAPSQTMHGDLVPTEGYFPCRPVWPSQPSLMAVVHATRPKGAVG